MNATEFVEAIRSEVLNSSAEGTISLLQRPPGRRPDPKLAELSRWYNELADDDKKRVREVVLLASHGAVFGFLTVLDGLRAIENGYEKGTLELRYLKDGEVSVLNSQDEPPLHDLLQQK